jgi:hypothetical protein
MSAPVFVFAHGAGGGTAHPWMQGWVTRLSEVGSVRSFDYPYMEAGRKAPDRLPKLLARHAEVLAEVRAAHPDSPVFLAGKSMGSRVGCHLAVEEAVAGVICFGYPLVGQKGQVRDEVLLQLRLPVLFIQGTRDRLCPLDVLAEVRPRMQAETRLHVVHGGDHSLKLRKMDLSALGLTQHGADGLIEPAVREFVERLSG